MTALPEVRRGLFHVLTRTTPPRLIVKKDGRHFLLMAIAEQQIIEACRARDPQLIADHLAAQYPGVPSQWIVRNGNKIEITKVVPTKII